MTKKDIDFDRIAREAREFREQEEQRIATEKEEEAKRVAAEKKAERERIAQAHEETLEKHQEDVESENALLASCSFDSRGSQPSPGTVKRRREWLSKLEKDAAARRRLEEEFNAMLAARRKQHPEEATADSEAAVKAAMLSSSEHNRRTYTEHRGVHQEADKSSDPTSQTVNEKATILANPTDESNSMDEMDVNVPPKDLLGDFNDSDAKDANDKNDDPSPTTSASDAIESTTEGKPIAQHVKVKKVAFDEVEYGAEVDPRTQAMLFEDDIMPSANKTELYDNDEHFKDRNKKTLALGDSGADDAKLFKKTKGSSQNNFDDEEDLTAEVVYKEASCEFPLEVTGNGLKVSPNVADLSMMTTIPPSRLGGRISGILEGKSSSGGPSNTATGSASLIYKSSKHSRLTLGMIRGCEPHHPLITIGGKLIRHGSSVGVTFYHNAKFLHQMMLEHSLWSLSFRHCFPDSKWSLSSELSRRKDLSFSVMNGNKLSGLIGWNLLKSNKFHARIDARPKLTEYRRAHMYCDWKATSGAGVWNFGISLVQSLHSQIATFGLGWRLFSSRGVEWVISWSRGNSTIRIPILVSKNIATTTSIGHTLYLSAVSYLIQDYIAEVWGWIGNEDDDEDNYAGGSSSAMRAKNLKKARRVAETQKELMARQARRKTNEEREKDGLVITEAKYSIESGEEWDATIPMQFWVTRSTLTLSERPKSELLGFYDIAASLKNSKVLSSVGVASNEVNYRPTYSRLPSLSDMMYDLLDWTPRGGLLSNSPSKHPTPTLTVCYEYKGRPHQITIKDREELRLPN